MDAGPSMGAWWCGAGAEDETARASPPCRFRPSLPSRAPAARPTTLLRARRDARVMPKPTCDESGRLTSLPRKSKLDKA